VFFLSFLVAKSEFGFGLRKKLRIFFSIGASLYQKMKSGK